MNIALVVDPLERAPEYVRWVATMRTGLEVRDSTPTSTASSVR